MPSGVAAPGGAVVVTASGATPFATPTTVCAGAPPRQPFPNAQYGPPPPGAAILGAGGAVTPTPSSHGPSPTPSSGSGGGSFVASGYAGRSKFGRMRGNSRQPMATPPTSPAKNRGKGKQAFFCPSSVLLWYPSTITGFGSALTNFLFHFMTNPKGYGSYRGSNQVNSKTSNSFLSPHMTSVCHPASGLITSPSSSSNKHAHSNFASMRARSPHGKYRGPQGTSFLSKPFSFSICASACTRCCILSILAKTITLKTIACQLMDEYGYSTF